MIYVGWIIADERDADELRAGGIEVGDYIAAERTFTDCRVPAEALTKCLDRQWGRWYWALSAEGEVDR